MRNNLENGFYMSDKKDELHNLILDSLSDDPLKLKLLCIFGKYYRASNDNRYFIKCYGKTVPLIELMGNLMTLSGVFLYAKFNKWRTETGAHPTDKERPNALYLKRLLAGIQNTNKYFGQTSGPASPGQVSSGLRVLRALDGLYNNSDMNFSVIKYLIINSQIEAGFNFQGCGGLSKLIGFPSEESFRVTCSSDVFKKDGQNLAAAFNHVSILRSDTDLAKTIDNSDKYDIEEISPAFEAVFKSLKFMERVRLEIDSEGNVDFIETTSKGEEKIPSYGVLRIFETDDNGKIDVYKHKLNSEIDFSKVSEGKINFFILEKIEYLSDTTKINAAVKLLYQSFDQSPDANNSVSVYFSEKEGFKTELKDCAFRISPGKSAADYFKRICGYLPSMRSSTRGIITANFLYFNVLAPSIVDAIDINLEAKKQILINFVKEEEALFKESLEPALESIFKTLEHNKHGEEWKDKIKKLCDYISDERHRDVNEEYNFCTVIDWDALILRILIYEGPSEILKTMLCSRDVYGDNDWINIENTCKKIIAGLEMRFIDQDFEACKVEAKQKEYYEKIIKPKIKELRKYDYPEKYFYKMQCKMLAQSYIDAIINELTNGAEKGQNELAGNGIQDKLEILKTYIEKEEYHKTYKVFLETIRAFLSFYAGILESWSSRMRYDIVRSVSKLNSQEIEEYRTEIEIKFLEGVNEENTKISKIFCDAPNKENAVEQALIELWNFAKQSEDTRHYEAVLGRAPINADKLAKIFKVNDGNRKIIFIDKEDIPFEKAKNGKRIMGYLGDVMRFLAGEDEYEDLSDKSNENSRDRYKDDVKKVVYPQVVTYAKKREDSDSTHCLIMKHSEVLAIWHKSGVQILTEFKYDLNHSFYALPNLNSIEPEWWVNPILVSCSKFDGALRKASIDKESAL